MAPGMSSGGKTNIVSSRSSVLGENASRNRIPAATNNILIDDIRSKFNYPPHNPTARSLCLSFEM